MDLFQFDFNRPIHRTVLWIKNNTERCNGILFWIYTTAIRRQKYGVANIEGGKC